MFVAQYTFTGNETHFMEVSDIQLKLPVRQFRDTGLES